MTVSRLLTAALLLSTVTTFTNCKKEPAPMADFTFPNNGTAPVTISFTNTSSEAPEYKWTFGDGATSTDRNPRHEYTKAGTYNVSLTVTSEGGSATAQKTLTVKAPTLVWIKGIRVTQMSFTDASGAGWDNNSGPDVYAQLLDGGDNPLHNTSTLSNLTAANLPLAWVVTPSLPINNFSATYKVRLYDQDTNDLPPSSDDFIGGYQFNMSIFAAIGYPTIGTIYINGNTLKIDLLLEWQ